ncbi:hypothetical protein BLNAU_4979 [Blattamonas nauphoetae]|uniref:Uncharacterized protein n=1 Tax=Blattamonas nauphoetae TaxID=2049346 RepID=A0ABQ9Y8R7_9EUKA|nr:hypothetical protein BLNAU_4979 [Blattamonas nauphoetae]
MTRRSYLSRMTPTRFCRLSSDIGNALIAGADEQILGSPPIVQKWFALLGWSFSTRLYYLSQSRLLDCSETILFISSKWDVPHIPAVPQPPKIGFQITTPVDYLLTRYSRSWNRPSNIHQKPMNPNTLVESAGQHGFSLHDTSSETEKIVAQQVAAVQLRAHIPKRKAVSSGRTTPALMAILENGQVESSMTGKEGSDKTHETLFRWIADEGSERTAASTLCVLHRMKLLDDELKPIIANQPLVQPKVMTHVMYSIGVNTTAGVILNATNPRWWSDTHSDYYVDGDGTVPTVSLSVPRKWRDTSLVKFHTYRGCDHMGIITDAVPIARILDIIAPATAEEMEYEDSLNPPDDF